jgi:hypothetical protein
MATGIEPAGRFRAAGFALLACLPGIAPATHADPSIGRIEITTVPMDPSIQLKGATYTPSGKVLVTYTDKASADPAMVKLAVMDDDGGRFRPFFAQDIPNIPKDNGLRFMVFADNKRIFLGDHIIECAPSLDACADPILLPVDYPAEVASGGHIAHRWSEIVVAPDNCHVAWTTLLANYSAIVFVGTLDRTPTGYRIAEARIVSTLNPFVKDPQHPDGVRPLPVLGGEVKQFVRGGTALSLVGAVRRDLPGSVVQDLATARKEAITDTPGYTETTIFSPNERLGLTMTTRFSAQTDPAVLGLLPRPYPDSLNMGLSMFAYTYAVTGVRKAREGSVGPALIDVQRSKTQPGYLGTDLTSPGGWVFRSPMSWHPGGTKAMWVEGQRGTGNIRIRIVHLPDQKPAEAIAPRRTPASIPLSSSDLSLIKPYARTSQNIDVKVYGQKAGYIRYHRTPSGLTEKTYVGFSDDGRTIFSGEEHLQADPTHRSTYVAKLAVTGAHTGRMDLQITFGPLGGDRPAAIVFDKSPTGTPLSYGYAEYDGRRLQVDGLLP